jgi:hypothetical protein
MIAVMLVATVAGCHDTPPRAAGDRASAGTPGVAGQHRDAGGTVPPAVVDARPRPIPAAPADADGTPPAPAVAARDPAPTGVRLLGGRLLAQLPPGRSHDDAADLPGKILGCMEYETSIPTGEVFLTALDLGALASADLEADARAELKAWHKRSRVPDVRWQIAPFAKATPPLRIVKATPAKSVGYLCGSPAGDIPRSVAARYFVTQADGTVQIIDFAIEDGSGQRPETVIELSEAVMASLAPGPVALVREAGTRVLPNIPAGQDLEISMPADTIVTVSEGMDSSSIEVGRLRPMGAKASMDIVVWSHSCVPDYMDTERARRTKGTLLGLPVDVLRGRREGRFFEDITIDDAESGECSYITLLGDSEQAVAALRARLESGKRVSRADPTNGLR